MTSAIFQNPTRQAEFDQNGYVQVPLLTPTEVQRILDHFERLHPDQPATGFISGSYSPDYAYKKEASDCITDILRPHFDAMLQSYRALGAAFLYKQPGPESALPIHQDWTIVDEEQYIAVNVWLPLTQVTPQNGTLYILPGSHHYMRTLRAPTLPFCYRGHEKLMIDNMIPMELNAGEAVILNQSVAHYSPPNLSDQIRIALTAGVVSGDAQLIFHYQAPGESPEPLEIFEQDDDFLIRFDDFYHDIFQRPKMGQSRGHLHYEVPQYTEAELHDLIHKMQTETTRTTPPMRTDNLGWFSRLKKAFSP